MVRAGDGGWRRMISASTPVCEVLQRHHDPQRYYQSPMQLVLASASPRRAELLRTAGFAFEVRRRMSTRRPGLLSRPRPMRSASRATRRWLPPTGSAGRRLDPGGRYGRRGRRPDSRQARERRRRAPHAATAVGRRPRGADRGGGPARAGAKPARWSRRASASRPLSAGRDRLVCRDAASRTEGGRLRDPGAGLRGSSTGSKARGRTSSGCPSRRSTGCSEARGQ